MLKGTNSEELKKIKFVVQYAVLLAYHLILETAFLLDQRAMFYTLPLDGMANLSLTGQPPSVLPSDANVPCPEKSTAETDSSGAIDIHISDGFHEGSRNMGVEGDTLLCYEQYNPLVFSGFSASLKRAFGDSFPLSSSSHQSVSTYFGEVPNDEIQSTNEVSASPKSNDHSDVEAKSNSAEEMAPSNDGTSVYREAPSDAQNSGGQYEDLEQFNDDTSTVIDADSILVLMSRRNSSTGTICEQSHFSHIKFYRNFDVPLGFFLRDKLLNQVFTNSACLGMLKTCNLTVFF